jgi:hypothetical protein
LVDAAHAVHAKNAVSWRSSTGSVIALARRPCTVVGLEKNRV